MNSRGVGTLRGVQGRLGALIAMIRALGTHVSGLRRDVAALIVDRPTHHAPHHRFELRRCPKHF